ncbi:MAG: hypothetical protein HC945_00680 [Nitrosarchaeum sp.]|nr:hypothetical protein [Nitrosarchaeum sp.]
MDAPGAYLEQLACVDEGSRRSSFLPLEFDAARIRRRIPGYAASMLYWVDAYCRDACQFMLMRGGVCEPYRPVRKLILHVDVLEQRLDVVFRGTGLDEPVLRSFRSESGLGVFASVPGIVVSGGMYHQVSAGDRCHLAVFRGEGCSDWKYKTVLWHRGP